MSARLVVLYPHPLDPDAFERQYREHHMPLMRRLVGPGIPLVGMKVRHAAGDARWIYRVAQIEFPSAEALDAYVRSPAAAEGRLSSEAVSTGGAPTFLICDEEAFV